MAAALGTCPSAQRTAWPGVRPPGLPKLPRLSPPLPYPLLPRAPLTHSSSSSSYSSGLACRGFVGEAGGSATAGAYYDSDFTWESRVAKGEAALARQLREQEEWRRAAAEGQAPYDRGSWESFHAQHGQVGAGRQL